MIYLKKGKGIFLFEDVFNTTGLDSKTIQEL